MEQQDKIDKICELVWNIPNEKWNNNANGWNFTSELNGMKVLLLIGELSWPAIHVDGVYIGGKREENIKLKIRLQEWFRHKKEGGGFDDIIDNIYNTVTA